MTSNRTRDLRIGFGARRGASLAVLAVACAVPSAAFAQEPAAPAAESAELPQAVPATPEQETVVITGSYLSTSGDSGSPVRVLDLDAAPPAATMGELFLSQPEFNGNAVLSDPGANSQTGASFINLRGLGPNATLILLNGRRQTVNSQPNTRGEYGVDSESLTPSIMLQRVEVVKDGASATYGTDAVAGVVNFITRKKFNGAEMQASWDRTEVGGQDQYTLAGMVGGSNDKASFVIGAEYVRRDPLYYYDYDEVVDYAQVPGALALSTFGNPATYRVIAGQTYNTNMPGGPAGRTVADPLCGDPRLGTDGRQGVVVVSGASSSCRSNTQLGRSIVGGEDRITVLATGSYDVSPYFQIDAQAGFTRKDLFRDGAYGLNVSFAPIVPASNPGNPYGGAVTFSGRVPGAGSGMMLASPTYTRTYHASLNFGGKLPIGFLEEKGWRWDVGLGWSENSSNAFQQDTVKTDLQNALNGLGGPNCNVATGTPGVGNCMYYNPFASAFIAATGSAEANDPALMQWLLPAQNRATATSLITWQAILRGNLFELPGGSAGIAFGYEGRRETASSSVDPTTKNGGWSFITQEFDFDASRTYNSLFFEVLLPILPQLEIQGAGRYEAYEGHNSFNPKIGVVVRPADFVTLRGTYGKSFQAPALRSVYGTSSSSLNGIVFPGINAVSTKAVVSPNPALKPQSSKSFTAGIDLQPVEGLRLSADYYSIDFTDLVGLEAAQLLINDYIATGANGDRLVFDPTGTSLVTVFLQNINAASVKTAGWDFSASYRMETGVGRFNLTGAATMLDKYSYQQTIGGVIIDGVGSSNSNLSIPALPKWKGNAVVTWQNGSSSALAAMRYVGGLTNPALAADSPLQNPATFATFDLNYSYRFKNVAGGPLTIKLGVVNLFDKLPPFQAGQQFFPIFSGVYDPRGRRFTVDLRKSF